MVLDLRLSLQGENAISTGSVNHSLLEDPILVSDPAGIPGRLSSDSTNSARSGGDAAQQEFLGSIPTDHLAYLRQSYSSQGFLHRLQASCSPPGETKPTQIMAPLLLNGLAGITSRVEIPFQDLYQML